MIDRDNITTDAPEQWDQYSRMLHEQPPHQLPSGFAARLQGRFDGTLSERLRHYKMRLISGVAVSLATVLMIVWMGKSMMSNGRIANMDKVTVVAPPTSMQKMRSNRGSSHKLQTLPAPIDIPSIVGDTLVSTELVDRLHDSITSRSVEANREPTRSGAVTGMPPRFSPMIAQQATQ